ncbi:MAG: hypothetical protein CM15mP120_17440 [Pseudomonadota bacterium]|nr:MAG: hypothetical protein CM15mP120_17440 [Pseudomonadota bacterium]
MVIITASLGTQRLAAKLPQPTETFKISEMFKEIRQIAESLKNGNFAALFLRASTWCSWRIGLCLISIQRDLFLRVRALGNWDDRGSSLFTTVASFFTKVGLG